MATDREGARRMPADPQLEPEQAVDALEERVFGETHDQTRDEDDDEHPPAEQDREPGADDTADEQPG